MFKSDPIIPCGGVLHSHTVPYTTTICFIGDWTFILINFTCLHFNKEIGEKNTYWCGFYQAFEWNCSSIFCAACCSNALNNQPYRRGEKENEFGGTIFL